MMRAASLVALVALPLAGCAMMSASTGALTMAEAAERENWRTIATENDRARIRDWLGSWREGLRQANLANAAAVTGEGALLDPMAGLTQPLPPAGNYRCRTIKLGAAANGSVPIPADIGYVTYPAFHCRITANRVTSAFTKLDGSQRPQGIIYRDTDTRGILLGTLVLGDESAVLDYGTDAERDLAGLVERVGPERWRLVFPRPAFESVIDVMELVPDR